MNSSTALIRAVRKALSEQADPAKAPLMQAYMKSMMPYLGIQTQLRVKTVESVFRDHPLESFDAWRDTVLRLWRKARYREERYAAITLAQRPAYREFRTLESLPMFEEMIVSGAWWDYVDELSTRAISELLRREPVAMSAVLREWAGSDNIWKRRSSIIAQLNFKSATDLALLYDCMRPSLAEKEFFLRKAIGWALRQYARTDAREVARYVREHEAELSPLSKREALKHVGG